MQKPPANPIHVIQGRAFRGVMQSTLLHDTATLDVLRSTGLDDFHMLVNESPEDYLRRMNTRLQSDMNLFALLGCLIMPADRNPLDWTPQMGEETANFLQNVYEPEGKNLIRRLTGEWLQGFLLAELRLLAIFQRYSTGTASA